MRLEARHEEKPLTAKICGSLSKLQGAVPTRNHCPSPYVIRPIFFLLKSTNNVCLALRVGLSLQVRQSSTIGSSRAIELRMRDELQSMT